MRHTETEEKVALPAKEGIACMEEEKEVHVGAVEARLPQIQDLYLAFPTSPFQDNVFFFCGCVYVLVSVVKQDPGNCLVYKLTKLLRAIQFSFIIILFKIYFVKFLQ